MCTMTAPPSDPVPSIDLDREPPPPKRSRARTVVFAAVGVAVAAAVVAGLYLSRDAVPPESSEPEPSHGELAADPPATGEYAIRAVHSGLCLGTGPELKNGKARDKEVFTQQDCGKRAPSTGLTKLENGLYRINVHHPQRGPGCGQLDGETSEGPGEWLMTPQTCADHDRQYFLLERDGDAYLIRTNPDTGQCLGILEGSKSPGAQVVTGACGKPAQKWYVEKP